MSWSLKHGKTTSVPIRLDFAKNTSALWRVEKPDCEMMGEWKPSLNYHVLQQTLKTVQCPIPTYPRRLTVGVDATVHISRNSGDVRCRLLGTSLI